MGEAVPTEVGAILQDIGGFGVYQKCLCVVIVGAVNWLCAFIFATQLFSLVTPDHWCWEPNLAALEEQLPLEQEDGKKFSLPVITTRLLPWSRQQEGLFSQCERYNGDLVGAYISWVAARRPPYLVPSVPGRDIPYSVRKCSEGWIYNSTFRTLVMENDWVCSSKWKPHMIHLVFWLGAAVGGYTSRYTINQFGRRSSLIGEILVLLIGGGATLLSTGFTTLLIARFITGLGHISTSFTSLLIVWELCDEKHKVVPLVVVMVAHSVGILAAPWIAHAVASWWWLALISTLFSLGLCLILPWVAPESPWWLCERNRHGDARKLLQRMAHHNKKENVKLNHISEDFWIRNENISRTQRHSISRSDLLAEENVETSNSFIIQVLWVLCGLCYIANYYNSIHLVATAFGRRSNTVDVFLSFWYTSLMEVPVSILPFILQSRPMIQKLILGMSLTTFATVGIYYSFLTTGYTELSLVIGLLSRFAITMAYYTVNQRYWETDILCRDTPIRSGGLLGLAAVFIPCIFYTVSEGVFNSETQFSSCVDDISVLATDNPDINNGKYYSRIPTFVFGIIALVAAITTLFLPVETHEDQRRELDILHRLRYWLQANRTRRNSTVTLDSEDCIARFNVSRLPYNPLESA